MNEAVKLDVQFIKRRFDTFKTSEGKKVHHKDVAARIGITNSAFAQHLKYGTMSKDRLQILAEMLEVSVQDCLSKGSVAVLEDQMKLGASLLEKIVEMIDEKIIEKLHPIQTNLSELKVHLQETKTDLVTINKNLISTNTNLVNEILEITKVLRANLKSKKRHLQSKTL